MSHPFGDLLSQHLHRKHGLSQSKLAAGILQEPAIITRMCKGERLTGPQARERVMAVIGWLCKQDALETVGEANALLNAAGLASLRESDPNETIILLELGGLSRNLSSQSTKLVVPLNSSLQSNLPVTATPFIGRTEELSIIQRHLNDPRCRLLTLVGPGGVGKTRLAIEAATSRMYAYTDGVYFVDLQPVMQSSMLANTIADALHMTLSGGDMPLKQVKSHLANKRLLLVLDNFEHLVEEGSTAVVELLNAAPNTQVLITSRQVVNLSEEWQYWVHGVSYPTTVLEKADVGMLHYDAVRLFSECARRVLPDFSVEHDSIAVANICRLTEGIPLAIEMAAAWVKTLSIADIAQELDRGLALLHSQLRNVPLRHKSMQAVFDHSWEMLSESEQATLARLAVFRGGFTRDAATQIAHISVAGLASLIDKSLLQRTVSGRYTLHEVVRQYLYEKLTLSNEKENTRCEHYDYFLALAQSADRAILGPDQFVWVQQLEAEHDNLREALEWCQGSSHRTGLGLKLTGVLTWFWFLANSWHEGYRWAKYFVTQPQSQDSSLLEDRAIALFAVGGMALAMDNYEDAIPCIEESIHILRNSTDTMHLARSLCGLGIAHLYQAQYEQAQLDLEESIVLFQQITDEHGGLFASAYQGEVFLCLGQYERAWSTLQECLKLNQPLGYTISWLQTLINLGRVERTLGRSDKALEHIQTCFQIADQFGILRFKSQALSNLGWLALLKSAFQDAKEFFQSGLKNYWHLFDYMGVAESLECLALIASEYSDWTHAAFLLGSAKDLRSKINVPVPIEYRVRLLSLEEMLRRNLTPDDFLRFEESGRSTTIARVVASLLNQSS